MIVGRKSEIHRLETVFNSKEAEFVVLYGRRRVGKTFLIREFFASKNCKMLQVTGLTKGSLKEQLTNFAERFSEAFTDNVAIRTPISWHEAFQTLNQFVERQKKKTVIFLDELPWMATPRSGLLQEIDYYWNCYWSNNRNVILIVCGSSASWLIKNIIYDTGGLHNRCTAEMKLSAFSLAETMEFLLSRGVKLNHSQVLDLYMSLGGIPYYLKYVEKGLTAAENIQHILFAEKAPLKQEFNNLFKSLFKNAKFYIDLTNIIAQYKDGLSRSAIEKIINESQAGGRLTERLEQLVQTDFIIKYIPWGKEHGEYFKVIDEFCLFYLKWMVKNKSRPLTAQHWLQQIQKPAFHVWAGYAFEAVCYKHIELIIRALHIKNAESISSWRLVSKNSDAKGAQIDLLIERSDEAITLLEIKYTNDPYLINKEYAANLNNKIRMFQQSTKTNKQIFLAMVSANGVAKNQYANELLSGVVTMDDLF